MPETNNQENDAVAESKRPKHRSIIERLVVKGKLILETPASFGNGDADAFTDIPLMEDETDGSPLLTGTSIAGALRNYLREREFGYCKQEDTGAEKDSLHVELFGGSSGDEQGGQSPLIVHDALGKTKAFELRDGVKIDLKTRTAEDDKKFDFELLAAGAKFDLRFELLISEQANRHRILQALAIALEGLAKGGITLGARKRRGFGRCKVSEWEVTHYDLKERKQFLAWLAEGRGSDDDKWAEDISHKKSSLIVEALGGNINLSGMEKRQRFSLNAEFSIDGSLLIRSGFGEADSGADMVHLHSLRNDQPRPIIPGTSWTGAIRSRATQIAKTLSADQERARLFIESIFGEEVERKKNNKTNGTKREPIRASRIEIAESEITNGKSLRQSRVKIDRFTGGAFESALFDEEPLFGNDKTRVALDLNLRLPEEVGKKKQQAEIGLLLLVLKDLWTGDLALGGEVGVGRGRFKGQKACITWQGKEWTLARTANDGLSVVGDKGDLEQCVKALKEELSNG